MALKVILFLKTEVLYHSSISNFFKLMVNHKIGISDPVTFFT